MRKYLLSLIIIVFLMSGCGNTIDNALNQNEEPNQQQLINVKNSTIEHVDRKSGQQISRHLVKLATSIPNVNDATAVVLGKYAIVGIDVNAKIDRSQVGSIKYSVAESLKHDPYGARAIVVADPDLYARINEIGEDIQNGKPVEGIMNELADISGRLMPEIPADMIDPKPKNAIKEPKQKLNQNEDKILEKQQDKQSNYHKD